MNDQQRARELLLAQYIADGMPEVAEDFAAGREWAVERSAIAAIAAALRAAPEGFVMVPVEATIKMLDSAQADPDRLRSYWAAMLAARPQWVKDA